MVPEVRIELTTYPLPRGCATTTLLRLPVAKPGTNVPGRGSIAHAGGKGKGTKIHSKIRQERLARALRENLKRRKTVSPASAGLSGDASPKDAATSAENGAGHGNGGLICPDPAVKDD